MQQFDAIRPYSDEETGPAIHRLVNDTEFLDMIGRFKSPRLAHWAPSILRFFTRRWLIRHFGHYDKANDLQAGLSSYVGDLVDSTTTQVTTTGLDRLDKNRAYLFISNHRDIVFDPMVVNYLLFQNGFHTTRIAIGDNLLANRVFAEMMRLNKSFVVRRNMTSPREMRDAYITLSGFINHSIETNHSIWIAQREGRAKDGLDVTDPAIIKMFYMSRKKSGLSFAEAISHLNIVPVSIAYEYDPCDIDKARELETRARTGSYTKSEGEDTEQIMRGLTGFKGHVHVHFGAPVQNSPENPKDLASHIDREMHANYYLHASNLAGWQLRGEQPTSPAPPEPAQAGASSQINAIISNRSAEELEAAHAEIRQRLSACDPATHPYLLNMYANPVVTACTAIAEKQTPS
jgi:hypothetical protein